MKWILLVLVVLALVIAGCDSVPDEVATEQTEDQMLEDQVIVDDDILIEVVDDVINVDASDAVEDTINYTVTQSLEEWCIAGNVYSEEIEGMSSDSEIVGITTRDGERVCELYSVTSMDVPVMGLIEVKTSYFLNEDISEMWAVIDTMGEITETHVTLQ